MPVPNQTDAIVAALFFRQSRALLPVRHLLGQQSHITDKLCAPLRTLPPYSGSRR